MFGFCTVAVLVGAGCEAGHWVGVEGEVAEESVGCGEEGRALRLAKIGGDD